MANTIGTPTVRRESRQQFQSVFDEVIMFQATISDQDAISAGDTASFSLTVTGAELGDFVLVSSSSDLSDGTDQAIMTGVVTAADTVAVRVQADVGAYAADDLNNTVVRGVVLKMFAP